MRRFMSLAVLFLALGCGLPGEKQQEAIKEKQQAEQKKVADGQLKEKVKDIPVKPIVFEDEVAFYDAYGKNVVAANERLIGKLVEIKLARGGLVQDDQGRYLILLSVSNGTTDIVCVVHKDSLPKLAAAKLGGAFHLRGRCLGRKNAAGGFHGYSIGMGDCEVLQVLRFQDGKGWVSAEK